MTRLFFRFYLGVIFILFTAWLVQGFVYRQRSLDHNIRVVEQAMAGGLRVVRDRLDAADESRLESTLRHIQDDFEYPVEVVAIDEQRFSPAEIARLRESDEIVFYVHTGGQVATALSTSQNAVSFGPLPSFVGPSQAEALAGLGLVLLLAAMAIAVLLRPVARQLREVERTATAIAEGDLSARVDATKVPKGQQLASAFNTMADRTETLLRTQRELLQAVSHELRTPLARMRFAIDLIGSAKSVQERQERLDSLDAAAEELDELVGELLGYVRMETTEAKPNVQAIELAKAVNDLIAKQISIYTSLRFDTDQLQTSPIVVHADVAGLQRTLGNLIHNACRYAQHCVRVTAIRQNDLVVIDVEDDGQGIPIAERSHVLEPFVRIETEDDSRNGRGVGLGLALVNRIVTRHGGQILIDDSELGGCRVRTTWPEPQDLADAQSSPRTSLPTAASH